MPGTQSTDPETDDLVRVIGRSWGWVLFFGVATVALGALVAIRPAATIYGFAILIGIWLFVSGLFRIVTAIADDEDTAGTRTLLVLLGLVSVLVGLFFLRRTYETVATLAFLIGIFWVVGGLIELFSAYGHRRLPGRRWRIAMGVLGFAAGVVTLVVPAITLVTLVYLMGIWLMVYGVLQVVTSFELRKLASSGG